MNLARTMLRPVAALGGMIASRQVKAFLAAHQRTREVQDHLLAELIARHAETAFGRDHGFASIRCYEDFIAAVPVRSFDQLRGYADRVFEGETTALLPGDEEVLMFSLTSGTTGEPKHIPVTRRFLQEMRRGWNIFGLTMLRDHPTAWLRPILPISSPMDEYLSPTGIPCGAISGLLVYTQQRIVRRMYVVPPSVTKISDPAARYYTTLRCGLGRDVAVISTANPSSTIKLIETGQAHAERLIRDVADGALTPPGEVEPELVARLRFRRNPRLAKRMEEGLRRDGKLLPGHFWNVAFLTNWTGGTVGLYLPRLQELFPGAAVRDIGLLASEGRFSIPPADDSPAGVAEITANVLEFIPAEEYGRTDPSTLRADELETGREYFLVLSNWAGLWRYSLDDRVRVTGRFGRSPVFEFLSRGRNTASITGEKITEHQVVEAVRLAARRCGADVRRFVVQGRFARTPFYELRLEMSAADGAERLAAMADDELGELNVEYRSKRDSGRLGPIRPIPLEDGALERIERENIRRNSGRSEQYKHQYLLTDVLAEEQAKNGK